MGMIETTAVKERSMSRVDADVECVKKMTSRVEHATQRIIQHARSLGYGEPPSEPKAAPTPVITTLADGLRELDRAIDHCAGSLNAFD